MVKRKAPQLVAQPDVVRIVPLHGYASQQHLVAAAPAKLTHIRGHLRLADEEGRRLHCPIGVVQQSE